MKRTIAVWLVRFVVAGAIFAITSVVWINETQGWERLGVFIAALVFGGLAVPAWCLSIAIARQIANATVRLVAHPVATVLLFVAFAVAAVGWYMETPAEYLWRDLRPFVGLVAASTIADTAAGFALEHWRSAAARQTS